MVLHLSRSQIAPQNDPHDWNTRDHYITIHESRLREHPFVVNDTLAFTDEDEGVILLRGAVQCQKNTQLDVEKWYETRYFGNTLRVRCHTYVYIGWLRGEHLLLEYHNVHRDRDEYHHRIYDPASGVEVFHEILERYQFPLFTEVLDELQVITQNL